MPAAHRPGLRVYSTLTIPESELSWRFSRSSGPGGQHLLEDPDVVIQSSRVLHLRYRVRR